MTTTLFATFDGEVLRPEGPVTLAPNTRVRVTIETTVADEKQSKLVSSDCSRVESRRPF